MEDDLIFLTMEDELNFFENGRRTQKKWGKNEILTNSTGNLTNTTTKSILAQLKKNTKLAVK